MAPKKLTPTSKMRRISKTPRIREILKPRSEKFFFMLI
jgi:hypothetical protein